MIHADIGASKTIRDRAIQVIENQKVHVDFVKLSKRDLGKRPKQRS